jgi:hypothetical protein
VTDAVHVESVEADFTRHQATLLKTALIRRGYSRGVAELVSMTLRLQMDIEVLMHKSGQKEEVLSFYT